MISIKLFILVVILISLLCPETVEGAGKKQRRNVKHKKITMNGKLKVNLKQGPASKVNQRNGKMHYYNSPMWPTTTTFYRPATSSSFYQRSPSTTSTSTHYPIHWGNSYMSPPSSFMPANTLRRTDDFSPSSPMSTAQQSSVMSMQSLNSPLMSMSSSSSQIPTLYDMSAFTGNVGLMEHPLTSSNQNLWSMGETIAATPKTKLNLFNSFNYNDDGDMFGGFLNQFLK